MSDSAGNNTFPVTDEIIQMLNVTKPSTPEETAMHQFTLLNINGFLKNAHPLTTNRIPPPYPTDIINGIVFMGNKGSSMELFAMQFKDNPHNTCFVPMNDLITRNQSHFFDRKDIIHVPIHDKFNQKTPEERKTHGNSTVAKYINLNSLEKKDRKYFISFFKDSQKIQQRNFKEFCEPFIKTYNANIKKPEYKNVQETIRLDVISSPLPKYTFDKINYEYAQRTGQPFKPKFSNEDHLKEIAQFAAKHPKDLKTAYQKASTIAFGCANMLFTEDNVKTLSKKVTTDNRLFDDNTRHSPKLDAGVRLPEVQIRTQQNTHSMGHRSRGRA
jgi:hypothetical protein